MTTDLSRIDHVILGIGDLQRGTAELERLTGVRAVFGGAHPGRGTQNALISLGDHHYLEILAPNPAEAGNPEAAELSKLTALTPIGWAVRIGRPGGAATRACGAGARGSTRSVPAGGTCRTAAGWIGKPSLSRRRRARSSPSSSNGAAAARTRRRPPRQAAG